MKNKRVEGMVRKKELTLKLKDFWGVDRAVDG
jgi:hypothetical protein